MKNEALQKADAKLALAAKMLGTDNEGALALINRYLPAKVNQDLYLKYGPDFGKDPQVVGAMFTSLMEGKELKDGDEMIGWELKEVRGKIKKVRKQGLGYNAQSELEDRFKMALELNSQMSKEIDGLELTEPEAVVLVVLFGHFAEGVLADLCVNLGENRRLLNLDETRTDTELFNYLVRFLIRALIADRKNGQEISVNGQDYLDRLRTMNYSERRAVIEAESVTWEEIGYVTNS